MLTIETTRLILRPFTEADVADLFDYAKHPAVGPAAGWTPHKDEAESLKIIQTVFCALPDNFAMQLRDGGKVIGSVGFAGRHCDRLPGPDNEIGYTMHVDYWGRGYMTEAVRAVMDYGFTRRGLETIWCNHYEKNSRSRAVIERCGFRWQFSEEKDVPLLQETRLTRCYAMTRAQWQEQRP